MDVIELPEETSNVDVCVICGEVHFYENCDLIKITKHVPDSEIPSRAKLTLPSFLQLQILTDGSYSVATKSDIDKGTQFGPFIAEKSADLSPTVAFPIKIFANDKADEYYLDLSDENKCSWMIFVSPAEYFEEQNLFCYQEKSQIYYVALRDINSGENLKVWYAPYYAQKMKKPLLKRNEIEDENCKAVDINNLIKEQQKIIERKTWTCKFCGQVETTIVTFASHIRKHYMSQMRNQCEICKSQFVKKNSLLRHIHIVHNNVSHIKPTEIIKRPSEQSLKIGAKESAIGGPLLVDIFTDSSDLPQTDFSHLDLSMDNSNLLLDTENLSMENLLNDNIKDLDHFNFDIDENQKQFFCDICLKQFPKLKSLIIHLKQHTGDFTCYKCLKVFCRRENLKSHSCTYERNFHICRICDKKFTQQKYLSRHFKSVHIRKYSCSDCNKTYYSNKELIEHNCSGTPLKEKERFNCPICDREFYRKCYLRRHLRTHSSHKPSPAPRKSTICQICGQFLVHCNSLYLHQKKHREPIYSCNICDKKFSRPDSLSGHMASHKNEAEEACNICDKKFKTKKTLRNHLISHSNRKQFKCAKCSMEFKMRNSLNKHIKQFHNENSKSRLVEYYNCPICKKKIKLRSSLSRHIRKIHPDDIVDISEIEKLRTSKSRTAQISTKTHEIQVAENSIPVNEATGLDKELEEQIDKLLNNSEVSLINLDQKKAVANLVEELDNESMKAKEVCLSIPDLSENDQEITLDKNAYIMENGTIVQPQSSDKVVIYVLDEAFQQH